MTHSSYERIADLPLEIESLSLEGLELRFSEEFTRQTTLDQAPRPRRRRRGRARTWPTTASTTSLCRPRGRRARPRGLLHPRLVRAAAGRGGAVAQPAGARGLGGLPALGLRVERARPGPAAGRPLATGCARARSPSGQLRRVDAARVVRPPGAGPARPPLAAARALPQHPLQARPHQRLDPRAGADAGGHRCGRLARPEGLLQGHAGGRRDRPAALHAGDRVLPRGLAGGSGRQRRHPSSARPRGRPRDLGRAHPLRGRTCSRAPGRREW